MGPCRESGNVIRERKLATPDSSRDGMLRVSENRTNEDILYENESLASPRKFSVRIPLSTSLSCCYI